MKQHIIPVLIVILLAVIVSFNTNFNITLTNSLFAIGCVALIYVIRWQLSSFKKQIQKRSEKQANKKTKN